MSQTVHVVFRCNEGQGANLVAIFGEALVDTRAFDGCESVEVYVDADNPDTIVLWEKFATRAHHEAYLAWRIETGMLDGAYVEVVTGVAPGAYVIFENDRS